MERLYSNPSWTAAGNISRRRRRRGTSALFYCFWLLLSFSLLVVVVIASVHNTSASDAVIGLQRVIQQQPSWGRMSRRLMEQQQPLMPLCVGNLLDRRAYDGIIGGGDVLISRRQQQVCRLMRYTGQPIATCLDALFHQQVAAAANSSSSPLPMPDELLFVFMGDSRIRQQFFNFVKIIPNYDRVTVPSPIPAKYHGDIEMTSRILRLRVSFKWRPLVNDDLIHALRHVRETAASDPRRRPQFVLLSMAAWHMLREHGADIALYQRRMTQLGPILASMSSSAGCCGRIIWLRQYTSVDSYGDNGKSNTLVVSDKLRHYNRIALQRLVIKTDDESSGRRRRGVVLWDSSDPLADEYVRACAILKRYEHSSDNTKEYATAYANCNDYVHTGYSALSQATQILFNDLCNAHMSS